jgi:hypothetical protein
MAIAREMRDARAHPSSIFAEVHVPAHQRRNVSNVSLAAVRITAISVITMYAVMGMPARSSADDDPSERPWPLPWPCQLIVHGDLRELAELAWEHSPTFRDQCRKLAAAKATMIVEPVTSRETWRATTRIGKTHDGLTHAHARVRPAGNALELIAHELEHVIEFVEGVKFLREAQVGRSGVSLSGGAYETRRAIEAGRRVALEVRGARDSSLSTLTRNSLTQNCTRLAQNSKRNPNCH